MRSDSVGEALRQASNYQETDILKSVFQDSCEKNGVPASQRDELIRKGLELFALDAFDNVVPLGNHKTIGEYVVKNRIEGEETGIPDDLTEQQVFIRLAKAAETGDMPEYRRLRKKYRGGRHA